MTIEDAIKVLREWHHNLKVPTAHPRATAMPMAIAALERVEEARRETARGIARALPGELLEPPRDGYA